jgi:Coenzyme PQQ synthesis protein D (PqqD)
MAELKLRADRLVWQSIDGEIVALDLRSSEYIGVNPSGRAVWQELADGATKDDLVAKLVRSFDVDENTARRDLDAFLAVLDERGLLA